MTGLSLFASIIIIIGESNMLHLEIVARKSERTALIVHALRLKLSDHIEKRFIIAHHSVDLIVSINLDRKYQNRF